MKNNKHIAFTELSFQPFSEKFVTIIQYPKTISWRRGPSESAFCLRKIFYPWPNL